MVERPEEVDEGIRRAVESGKRLTLHFSPNTKVIVVSTDAAEAQQVLEAMQPVEETDAPAYIRHEAYWALLHAFNQEPDLTLEWMRDLTQLMEESAV